MSRLFGYELKKLLCRKIVWVSLMISLLLCGVTVCAPLLGSYYVNGEAVSTNYKEFQTDKAYQLALDGRVIDEALIREMQAAYAKVPLETAQYSQTEEYQRYGRPYSAIFRYVRMVTGLSTKEAIQWVADIEDLQEKRWEALEKRWESYLLTDVEKDYWRTQEEKLEYPVVYRYMGAYSVLISAVYTVGLVAIFVVSICLAGAFPQEHMKKTDQLILSSKYGRGKLFGAKFGAGMLFALGMPLIMVLFTLGLALVVYGTEGGHGAFQLEYAGSCAVISIGEAVLIAYTMVLFAGVFMGALVMMLSEVLRSSVGTLAIATGMMVLPMFFSMPEEYRVLSQLWSYLPSDFVAVWSLFNPRMVVLGNVALPSWQAVPVLYIVLGVVFALVTKRVFVRYQVSGR